MVIEHFDLNLPLDLASGTIEVYNHRHVVPLVECVEESMRQARLSCEDVCLGRLLVRNLLLLGQAGRVSTQSLALDEDILSRRVANTGSNSTALDTEGLHHDCLKLNINHLPH